MKLKTKFLILLIVVFATTIVASYVVFDVLKNDIISGLGSQFTERQVRYNRARILQPLLRELALARKLADSHLLKRWALNEEDPTLRSEALKELEGYRRFFSDRSFFFVHGETLRYYYNDRENNYAGKEFQYKLNPNDPEDRWYFASLESGAPYKLNVDHDEHLGVTKIWLNVVVQGDNKPLGIVGTGLDLSEFIAKVAKADRPGIKNIFVDESGAIQAHDQVQLIDFRSISKEVGARKTIFQLLDSESDNQRLRESMDNLKDKKETVIVLASGVGGANHLIGIGYMEEIGWYNITLVDADLIIGKKRFLGFAAILLVSMIVLSTFIVLLLDRVIIDRIYRLDRWMRDFSIGILPETPSPKAHDELGRLEEVFRQMTEMVFKKTRNLEERVVQKTIDLSDKKRELESALAEIKTLNGLLPICSNCKKIKDENGQWSTLEQYFSDRSDVEFSHGYCPECADEVLKGFKDR